MTKSNSTFLKSVRVKKWLTCQGCAHNERTLFLHNILVFLLPHTVGHSNKKIQLYRKKLEEWIFVLHFQNKLFSGKSSFSFKELILVLLDIGKAQFCANQCFQHIILFYFICVMCFPTVFPLYGVPTVRADIPAPRFRRISDITNYGDQASAYALLHPSIYSDKGVHEADFFKTRPKEEVEYMDFRRLILKPHSYSIHVE